MQTDGFWNFSLAFYAREPVKQQCLALQDEHGLNVNVILLCAYADVSDLALTGDQILFLAEGITEIDSQTVEHRQRRRLLRKGSEAYKLALRQELALEKQQQQRLVDLVNTLTIEPGSSSLDNLLQLTEPKEAQQRIKLLIAECHQFKGSLLQ